MSYKTINHMLQEPYDGIRFSMEFYPPRNKREEQRLWNSLHVISRMGAVFASVTYGAGGAVAHKSFHLAQCIQQDFHLPVLSHLTVVNHTVEELIAHAQYLWEHNIRHLLALRGDPPGDPLGQWQSTPGGIDYAQDLVELLLAQAPFDVGVAAFPEGHFRALSIEDDTQVLVNKFRAGANFAITQMFFEVSDFLYLRDRVAAHAPEFADIPIIPTVMPITSVKVIKKLLELSGSQLPASISRRLEEIDYTGDEAQYSQAVRMVGIEIATEISQALLREGVPCIQFSTLNYTKSARDVLGNLGVAIPALDSIPVYTGMGLCD